MKKIDQLRTKVVNLAIAVYTNKGRGTDEQYFLDRAVEELLGYLQSEKIMFGRAPEDEFLTQWIYGGGHGTRTICKVCMKNNNLPFKDWWTPEPYDIEGDIYNARQHVRKEHMDESR